MRDESCAFRSHSIEILNLVLSRSREGSIQVNSQQLPQSSASPTPPSPVTQSPQNSGNSKNNKVVECGEKSPELLYSQLSDSITSGVRQSIEAVTSQQAEMFENMDRKHNGLLTALQKSNDRQLGHYKELSELQQMSISEFIDKSSAHRELAIQQGHHMNDVLSEQGQIFKELMNRVSSCIHEATASQENGLKLCLTNFGETTRSAITSHTEQLAQMVNTFQNAASQNQLAIQNKSFNDDSNNQLVALINDSRKNQQLMIDNQKNMLILVNDLSTTASQFEGGIAALNQGINGMPLALIDTCEKTQNQINARQLSIVERLCGSVLSSIDQQKACYTALMEKGNQDHCNQQLMIESQQSNIQQLITWHNESLQSQLQVLKDNVQGSSDKPEYLKEIIESLQVERATGNNNFHQLIESTEKGLKGIADCFKFYLLRVDIH